MDKILRASLDWINEVAYPDAGFVHPNDENKVKCSARALNELGVPINLNEVAEYCEMLEMPKEAIGKIVRWYSNPNALRLKSGMAFSSSELKNIWEEMIAANN